MTKYVTKSGRVLTDEDIQKLADEAEQGYDVEQLKDLDEARRRINEAADIIRSAIRIGGDPEFVIDAVKTAIKVGTEQYAADAVGLERSSMLLKAYKKKL
jgi:pyridoxal biosynthesis lyase PdxS